MGILNFFSQFVKFLTNATTYNLPYNVSGISIDLNSIFYRIWAKRYGMENGTEASIIAGILKMLETEEGRDEIEKECLKALYDEIVGLVKRFQPNEYLMIAVDGVAPLAKITQQRWRRYKSQLNEKDPIFNSIQFSPGTELMRRIDEYLENKLNENKLQFGVKKLIYSSHLSPGEGEHKILDYYRSGDLDGPDYHVIVANDSDMVPLCLGLKMPKFFIFRGKDQLSIQLDSLRVALLIKMGVMDNRGDLVDRYSVPNIIDDFVLMTVMIGNDFLPPLPGLNLLPFSLDGLIENYKKNLVNKKYLTYNAEINMENLAFFFFNLSTLEPELLRDVSLSPKILHPILPIKHNITIIDAEQRTFLFDRDRFQREWWKQFDFAHAEPLSEIFDVLPINVKPKVLSMYVTGLYWVINYYLKGRYSINMNWLYPFFYSPTITDLANYTVKPIIDDSWNKEELSFSSIHQLLMIIPPRYSQYIPKSVRDLIEYPGELFDLAPWSFEIDKQGTFHEDGGTPIIPFINPYRVILAVNKIKFDEIVIASFGEKPDFTPEIKIEQVTQQQLTDKFNRIKAKLRREVRQTKREVEESRSRPLNEKDKKYREESKKRFEERREEMGGLGKREEGESVGEYRGRGGYRGRGRGGESGERGRSGYRGRGESGGYRGRGEGSERGRGGYRSRGERGNEGGGYRGRGGYRSKENE